MSTKQPKPKPVYYCESSPNKKHEFMEVEDSTLECITVLCKYCLKCKRLYPDQLTFIQDAKTPTSTQH